jgi:hypothetical protein
MSKTAVKVYVDRSGKYRLRLSRADGEVIHIKPGSVPGLKKLKGRAELHAAVQAGLKVLYDQQQAAAS